MTTQQPVLWISTITSKQQGSLRSRTLFLASPRCTTSPADSTTVWVSPSSFPRMSELHTSLRVVPCTVASSCTPRPFMSLAAITSCAEPISSITIAWGVWFCTASSIVMCCCLRSGTIMRRARPMAGWEMSPLPAISLLVSTISTRLVNAKKQAQSRRRVVLPAPGQPTSSTLLPCSSSLCSSRYMPGTLLPRRNVSPITSPDRFSLRDTRCRVLSMPARLSASENGPTAAVTSARSAALTRTSISSRSISKKPWEAGQ
mmetsp:Transcript_9568/g.20959  ORF Transcript_9568/g.20959 Transcript_9568/m.20959 type:complete len:259 (-) Transcript_9568:1736-2512(-)